MNITVASFDAMGDETEGHGIRVREGGPLDHPSGPKRLAPAGELTLDVSVEGNAIIFRSVEGDEPAADDDDDDAEGHSWRRPRFVELGNDVVEVGDADGVVRRYMRVGGSSHTPDALGMKYRLGGGPRI